MTPNPDLHLEHTLWTAGYRVVVGLDEAGRGALAGPVAVAAVALPPEQPADLWEGIRDSKQLSPSQREALARHIRQHALTWGIGFASAKEIDRLGIAPAVRLAALRALSRLDLPAEYLLLDHFTLPELALPQTALPHGDARVLSIAAASILAKTTRDALMIRLDQRFPGYGFARHKGYGTAAHREALRRLGPCPLHRRRFTLLPTSP